MVISEKKVIKNVIVKFLHYCAVCSICYDNMEEAEKCEENHKNNLGKYYEKEVKNVEAVVSEV